MTDDLINRSAVLEILNNEFNMAEQERSESEDEEEMAFNSGEMNCARRSLSKVMNLPALDAVPVVRCVCCVLHDHCTVEDMFILAGFNDGYCRAGKRLSNAVSGAKMDGEEDASD